jgi:CTP synthase (UTP-ammonia lyase)
MKDAVRVGIVGDYNPASRYHAATDAALQHAGTALDLPVEVTWVPTPAVDAANAEKVLGQFDALWCAPGSPYESMEGALAGIRYARERGRPFVGT